MAKTLPPIVNGLIECRLSDDTQKADLSQQILTDNKEPDILMNHIIGSGLSGNPKWAGIHKLCSQWQEQSSSIHDAMDSILFEIDEDAPACRPRLPSVFLRLKMDGLTAETQSALIEGLQILFGKPGPFPWQDILHNCFTFNKARLIYIGAMLARNTNTLRVEFIPQSSECIIPLLKHIGWSWDENELKALIEQLYHLGIYINLVHVDIASTVRPKIGLSCLCGVGPDRRPNWPFLLDHLVEAGLCSPDKRDGVLAWEGFTEPTSCPVPWPPYIISQSLLQPDMLSIFERDISHVKFIYRPEKPQEAKAYLRFNHRWLKPGECLFGGK
jgi:hypothetical protein